MEWLEKRQPAKYPANRRRIGGGALTSILHNKIIVIGDDAPLWNDGVEGYRRMAINLSAEKIYVKDSLNYAYLARVLGQWDARLGKWLAGLERGKKPIPGDTMAAYFKVAAQRHGRCSILIYGSEQILQRLGAKDTLAFIEKTREYCWYVLVGDQRLDGLEIPDYIRPRRIDISDFNLTMREMQVYFSASGILLTPQQYERLHRLVCGWTLAAYMLGKHMKRGEVLDDIDFDTAITELFCELDDLVLGGMDTQESYTAILLSGFETFPYALAVSCCPYPEGVIRKTLEKIPGMRLAKDGTELAMHPLVRAYWQTKRYDVPAKLLSGCKNRAANWYCMNRLYMPAFAYAVGARNYTLAREMLKKLNNHNRYQTAGNILKVLEQIDGKTLQAQPMLWAYKVAVYYTVQDMEAAGSAKAALEKYLDSHCSTADERQAKGEMLLLSGFLHQVEPVSIRYFAQAADCFDTFSEICDAYLSDATRSGIAIPYTGDGGHTLLDTCQIIQQWAPHLYRATNNWGRGLEHLCLVEYGYLTGNSQLAISSANKAITDAMAYHQWDVASMAYCLLLMQYIGLGMASEAIDTWRGVHRLARLKKSETTVMEDIADAAVFFNSQQLYLLPLWARDGKAFEKRYHRPWREYYIRAFYLLCKGEPHNALRLVCEALGRTRFTNEWIMRLRLLVLKMILCLTMGDTQQTEELLNECYLLAAPEGILAPFAEFGDTMAGLMDNCLLLKEAGPDKPLPPVEWMQGIRQAAANKAMGSRTFFNSYFRRLQQPGGTTLTGNEYILLQMLCLDYTSDTIKEVMGVSKKHINAVMRRVCKKLGVANGEEAISFGRSINMQDASYL